MDDREFSNVYTIPPNYTDSGKLLGGMLETRNTIEAVFLLLLVGYPELMWMHLPGHRKVVVMTMTLLPMGVFALMGIGGDSLLQFATHIVLFWMRRRQLHYREDRVITMAHQSRTGNTRGRKAPPTREGRPSAWSSSGLHPDQRPAKRHR